MSAVSDDLDQGTARVRPPVPHVSGGSPAPRTPDPGPRPLDCSHCGAAGSVMDGYCEVCYAEPEVEAADLPPAAPASRTYRMTDVIAEIRSIRTLALDGKIEGDFRLACDRLEDLLRTLRRQFVSDVILGHPSRTS
jgi:hypothetical protein